MHVTGDMDLQHGSGAQPACMTGMEAVPAALSAADDVSLRHTDEIKRTSDSALGIPFPMYALGLPDKVSSRSVAAAVLVT